MRRTETARLEQLQGLETERSAVPKFHSPISAHTLHPSLPQSLQSSLTSLHSQLLASQLRLSSAALQREVAVQALQAQAAKLVESIQIATERSEIESRNVEEMRETMLLCEEEIRVWEGVKAAYVGEYEEVEERLRDFRRKQTEVDCAELLPALRDMHREGGREALETVSAELEASQRQIAQIERERAEIGLQLSVKEDSEAVVWEERIQKALGPEYPLAALLQLSSSYNTHQALLQAQLQLLNSQVPCLQHHCFLSALACKERLIETCNDVREKEQAERERKRSSLRLAAVDVWRREVIAELRTNEGRNWPTGDDLMLEKVNSLLLSHPKRTQLVSLFADYSKALNARESRFSTPEAQTNLQRWALLSAETLKERGKQGQLKVLLKRIEVRRKGKEAGERQLRALAVKGEVHSLAELLVQRSLHTEFRLSWCTAQLQSLPFLHASLALQVRSSLQRSAALRGDFATAEKRLKALREQLEGSGCRSKEETEAQFTWTSTQKAIALATQQYESLQGDLARFDSQATSPVPAPSLRSRSDLTRSPIRRRQGWEVSPISSEDREDLLGLLEGEEWGLETCRTQPELITRLRPLLTGSSLYKKFSQSGSLRQPSFDPLLAQHPPEACGYGLRTFRLNPSLTDIEVRQGFRVESTLPLCKLQAVLIPRATLSVVKTQKKGLGRRSEKPQGAERLYRSMKAGGVIDTESPVYEALCAQCDLYPFYFLLEQTGRMDVIARGYEVFREWVLGANALVRRKSELEALAKQVRRRV